MRGCICLAIYPPPCVLNWEQHAATHLDGTCICCIPSSSWVNAALSFSGSFRALGNILFCCRRLLIGISPEVFHLVSLRQRMGHSNIELSHKFCLLRCTERIAFSMLSGEMILLCRPCRGHYQPQHAGPTSLPAV